MAVSIICYLIVVTCIAVLSVLSVYTQYTVTVRSSIYTLLIHVLYKYMHTKLYIHFHVSIVTVLVFSPNVHTVYYSYRMICISMDINTKCFG